MLIAELPIRINVRVDTNPIAIAYPLVLEAQNEQISFTTDTIFEITGGEKYEGEYIITPRAYDDQTLETKDKVCTDEITVLKVPKYETSNVSGGKTVYIREA
jgi:hypothetical protein